MTVYLSIICEFSIFYVQMYSNVLSTPRSLYCHLTVIQCKMSWRKRGFRWMTPWRLCLPEWAAVWWGSSLRSWSGPRWRWRKGSQRRWPSPLYRSGRPRTPACMEEKYGWTCQCKNIPGAQAYHIVLTGGWTAGNSTWRWVLSPRCSTPTRCPRTPPAGRGSTASRSHTAADPAPGRSS